MRFGDEDSEIYEDIDIEDIETVSDAEPDVTFKDAAAGFAAMVKALTLKKVLLIAALAVMVIAVPVVISLLPEKPNYFFMENGLSAFMADDAVIVSAGDSDLVSIDYNITNGVHSITSSMDGATAAILAGESNSTDGGELWYITTEEKQLVAENVNWFVMSDNGNAIVYLADSNPENFTRTLYLYDSETGESTLISDNTVGSASISPDGKTVSYFTDYSFDQEKRTEHFTSYIKTVGKPEEMLGENMYCLMVADDGKYIYYLDYVRSNDPLALHVRSENGDTLLISEFNFDNSLILNKDYSQILFDYQRKTYICRNGGEREFVADWEMTSLLLPRNTQGIWQRQNNSYGFSVCGVRDFAGVVFNAKDKYLYIDKNYSAIRIPIDDYYVYNYVSEVFLTTDGKTVIFTDGDGALCRFNFTDPYAEREIIAENGIQFTASDDGNVVYYLNREHELWRVKGTGKRMSEPVKISDGVSLRTLALSDSSDTIFFITNMNDYKKTGGTLFSSRNGDEKVMIRENVTSVWTSTEYVFYSVDCGTGDGKANIYRSSGGRAFELLCENVYR